MGGKRSAYGEEEWRIQGLVRNFEGKRPLGRPKRRWEDNIKMAPQEVGCGYMDWIELAQDRGRWRVLVNVVMNLRVSWNAGNFLTNWEPISFSRRTLLHGVSTYFTKRKIMKHHMRTFDLLYRYCDISCGQSTPKTLFFPRHTYKIFPSCNKIPTFASIFSQQIYSCKY